MHPTVKAARIAGAIYLSEIIVGPFSLIYVPRALVVGGNAAATAAKISTHETMFKLAILSDLYIGVASICLVLALYRLFKDVDRFRSAAMVILGGVTIAPIFFVNSLNWIAALTLVQGGSSLSALTTDQRQGLAMLFLHLHGQGNIVNSVFSGLWLFPFGSLVVKSGFIPRFLGYWLILEGFVYVAFAVVSIAAPDYGDAIFTYGQPAFFAEIATMLFLLIKGANVARIPPSAARAG
jgi:hypothetical protein